jgi:uncharacterized protein involved in cysteine biosynthesis
MKPLSHVAELADGLGAVLLGVDFVRTRPRLWLWIAVPFVINLALFLLLSFLAWKGAAALLPDLHAGDWGWFDWLRRGLGPVLAVLYWLVAALAAMLLTLLVCGIVNAPFYDLLSEQAEAAARGQPEPPRTWAQALADTRRALAAALVLGIQQAAVMAVLFALSFTAVGAPVFLVAGFFFAGFALADVTLSRRRLDARGRRGWARAHPLLLIGLGVPIAVVPPLQPFGIVGATLLLLDPRRAPSAGEAPAPLGNGQRP